MSTYNRPPDLHWYRVKEPYGVDAYMTVFRLGKNIVGFINEPEPKIIDRYGLTIIGHGSYRWMMKEFFKEV